MRPDADIVDPHAVAGTPQAYGAFVRGSKAEFGIAKSGYVLSRCGWFSDRSVCYLASGRPVVAQDTGFSGRLPTGDGLLPFTTIDDMAARVHLDNAYIENWKPSKDIAILFMTLLVVPFQKTAY